MVINIVLATPQIQQHLNNIQKSLGQLNLSFFFFFLLPSFLFFSFCLVSPLWLFSLSLTKHIDILGMTKIYSHQYIQGFISHIFCSILWVIYSILFFRCLFLSRYLNSFFLCDFRLMQPISNWTNINSKFKSAIAQSFIWIFFHILLNMPAHLVFADVLWFLSVLILFLLATDIL